MAAKFGAGESVSLTRGSRFSAPNGVYNIVRVLPRDSGPQQYRIKNERESFERVIDEVNLEPFRYG